MAVPKRFAIRDAGEATFYKIKTGKPIVTLTSLKTSGVETSGETVYARGGRGNAKLVGFSSNREAKLTLEDALFDQSAIQMLTGNEVGIGVKEIDFHEDVAVKSNKATLTKTPVLVKDEDENDILTGLFVVNEDGSLGDEITYKAIPATGNYKITNKEITLFTGDYEDDTILKAYYRMKTASDAATVKVTSDAFGGTFKVVIDVLVRDSYTKEDYAGQLIVNNAKFEDNFTLNFAAEGDPAVLNLPLEVLKNPTSTDMWELVIYDASDIS